MSISLISCDLFNTRTPENPVDNSVNYPPATSPDILLSNFKQSFMGLNIDNYYDCFVKVDNYFTYSFNFIPDPNALARYGSVFTSWDAQSERNFLIGLKASTEQSVKPNLTFQDGNYDVMTPDSAIYISEYEISVILQKSLQTFSGISRFTLIRSNTGLWYIKTWQDVVNNSIDTTKSWSILKAQLSL
jgi:hypothetical protein